MSMDQAAFKELIQKIQAQGYDWETASEFAVIVGGTPVLDEEGKIVVLDETGRLLAKLEPLWPEGGRG